MDFGYKGINNGRYFYNIPPSKPVVEQTIDLFDGIRKYCKYEIYKENKEYTLKERSHDRAPLFEIYPFMGINTRNYRKKQEIEELMQKYFENYIKVIGRVCLKIWGNLKAQEVMIITFGASY